MEKINRPNSMAPEGSERALNQPEIFCFFMKLFNPLPIQGFLFLLGFFFAGCSQSEKCVVIGRDPLWPSSAFDQLTNGVNGLTNALFQKMDEEKKISLQLVDSNPLNFLYRLDTNVFDGIVADIPMNNENLAKYDFSDPYLLTGPVLVIQIHPNISDCRVAPPPADRGELSIMEGKIVGICDCNRSILIAQTIPNVIIRHYQNIFSALDDLAAGQIDGLLMPLLQAESLIPKRFPNLLRIYTAPLTQDGLRLITLKDQHPHLISLFNSELKKMKGNGTYDRLKQKFLF